MIRLLLPLCLSTALIACNPPANKGAERDPISAPFAHQTSDLASDPAITHGVLPNGLRYALRANATPSDTASALLYIDAGSLDEADAERGLAHFLEHMAFNGSTLYPEGELIPALERLGLAFGADTNAYTTFDRTVYRLELPDTADETVTAALTALRETASNLTLGIDAIARERGVIQSERRSRRSPAAKASEESLSFFLEGTIYPDRLPIGTDVTIDTVPPEAFRAFYDGRYRPENAVLVMVGDFDVTDMQARLTDTFGDWQGRGDPLPIDRPDSLPEREPRTGTFIDPKVTTSITVATYGPIDDRADTIATRRDRLLDGIGNSLLNRRLARIGSEGSSDFLGANAASYPVFDVTNANTLTASSGAGDWQPALHDAVMELNKAREFCFSDAELAEWKANARRGLERAVETADTRRTPGLASQLLSAITDERVVTTPDASLERYLSYEADITAEDVCARFQDSWTGFEAADLFLVDSVEADEDAIRSAFTAALATPTVADAQRQMTEFAYTDWGTPGEVLARDTVEDIDFTTVDFANGVRLNIKRTDYAKDQVRARVSVGGGLFNTDWPEGFGQFAGPVLAEGGLKAHSVDELRTILAGRTASANVSVGTEMIRIDGGSSLSDMGLMFDLMAAGSTALGYREEAVSNFRRDLDALYDSIDSTPGGVATRDVPRLLRSGDPRFGISAREVYEGLSADTVRDIVDPLLASGLIEIGVVGDVEVEAVIEEVARTFGAFDTRTQDLSDYPDSRRALTFPEPDTVTLTHQGDPDTALFQVYFPAFDGSDTARTRRASLVRAIAQLKLTDVLREREGQSYSPSVGSYLPESWDDYGYMSVSVSADPQELDAISALVDEVTGDIRAGRITQDEFDRAIRPIRESLQRSLESNGYWLDVIDRARTYPEDLDTHRTRIAAYQDITLADVKTVAATLFDPVMAYRVKIVPVAS